VIRSKDQLGKSTRSQRGRKRSVGQPTLKAAWSGRVCWPQPSRTRHARRFDRSLGSGGRRRQKVRATMRQCLLFLRAWFDPYGLTALKRLDTTSADHLCSGGAACAMNSQKTAQDRLDDVPSKNSEKRKRLDVAGSW